MKNTLSIEADDGDIPFDNTPIYWCREPTEHDFLLKALYAIFDDKQHPFYEHRKVA